MSKTLAYCILYLIHHPEIQEKSQKEIDDAIDGNDDIITVETRDKIPFTEAVVLEAQRLGSVLPIAPPRIITKQLEIGGYTIKPGTQVQVNLYSLHRSQEHWKEPERFNPERFIDSNGHLCPDEWLQPFGYGKYIEHGCVLKIPFTTVDFQSI